MLLRVYVDTPEQFDAWVKHQQQPGIQDSSVAAGRHIFETQACTNCHTIAGTAATGTFGPDLTHLKVERRSPPARQRTRRRICMRGFRIPITLSPGR